MRTLFEILEAARHGQKPTHDECYYVMLMQSALHALDRQAIRSLLNEKLKIDPKLRAMVELVNNNIFDRNNLSPMIKNKKISNYFFRDAI